MARKLRIQYEGAMYHVINRGNYRREVFETVGAAQAFEAALLEGSELHGWQLHGYVIMRNHFHLAVLTPEPNLVEGMHWLQCTFATRFNRLRQQRGHLFQGRYQALLVQDAAALARVVDYIHLNPVRAGIVPAARVGEFRWSSLRRFQQPTRPGVLQSGLWLGHHGWPDDMSGIKLYNKYLIDLAEDEAAQKQQGLDKLSSGWAIGTDSWRKQVAKEHAQLALNPGLEGQELREYKESRWSQILEQGLNEARKTQNNLQVEACSVAWKIQIAIELRKCNAPYGWIAARLNMGQPSSVRVYVNQAKLATNDLTPF